MEKLLKNRLLNFIIKTTITILLVFVLYYEISHHNNLSEVWMLFLNSFSIKNTPYLILVILMMPLNWALETEKWRVLIKSFEPISFFKAYKAIFSGITVSMFTPNRIGEYGGRILHVHPENAWKTVVSTIVGTFAQLIVLLGFGLPSASFFIYKHLQAEQFIMQIIIFLSLIGTFLMLLFYFNIDIVIKIAKKIPFSHYFRKYIKHIKVLRTYSARSLGLVLFLATIRYWTYSVQYYLILKFLGVSVPFWMSLISIWTIFLLQTSLPLPPISGLLARGGIAIYVWSFFGANEISSITSTFSLWIINLVIPALIGLLFIVNTNIVKNLSNNHE